MSEKQSTFTVTDRRKFTLDGELRDPASAEEVHESAPAVVEAQPGSLPAATPAAATTAGADIDSGLPTSGLDEDGLSDDSIEEQLGPVPTSQESAEQHAAYQKSSGQLDEMIREANPGAAATPQADFERSYSLSIFRQ